MATATVTLELRSEHFTAEEMLLKFKAMLDSHEESLADYFNGAENADPVLECSIDGQSWVLDAVDKDDEDELDDEDDEDDEDEPEPESAPVDVILAAVNGLPEAERQKVLAILRKLAKNS